MASRGAARQAGAALVVALLVFALAATLLVAAQRDFSLELIRTGARFSDEQAWHYLLGAEALAAQALRMDRVADARADRARDDLTELWAGAAPPYTLDEGGWLQGRLADLGGRFNLNLLGAAPIADAVGAERFTPAQAMFIRLLQTLPEVQLDEYTAASITEAIDDWIDADSEPRFGGVEDEAYVVRSPPYRCANRPLASVSELRAIRGITPELYRSLEPLVTVWPQSPASINIHTAPLQLLRAINRDDSLAPLSLAEGEQLLRQREEGGFADVEAFLAEPVFIDAPMDRVASLLGEQSDHFLLVAEVSFADRRQRLFSVLRRQGSAVNAVQRARGSL